MPYPFTGGTAFQRCQRRADKLIDRPGWDEHPDLLYGIKRKGMHWKTYNRVVSELKHLEGEAIFGFASYFNERFADLRE